MVKLSVFCLNGHIQLINGLIVGDAPYFRVPPNPAHFGLRLPDPVHFFGHIRPNIGRVFSGERKTSSDWREPALSVRQKSAGIDRLQVEKSGLDVLLLAV